MGTVRQEVARIEANVANAYAAAAIKGASLPASETIANLASTINSISSQSDTNNSLCNYKVDLSEVTCGGGCVQNNTPTPSQPSNVICNNGEIRFNKRNSLPVGYTELSYLESTGTQAILTDYQPLGTDTIEVDYKLTNLSQGGDKFIIGSRPNSSAENVGFWVETYGATNTWYVRYGSPASVNDPYQNSDESGTFSVTKNVFKINGVTRLTPTYEGDPTYPMSIFARRNRDNTVWAGAYVQISNVRVYGSDNALKHNYVPAKRSDNVVGMYDTVTGSFFTNQGSGNFIAGQELQRIPDSFDVLDYIYFHGIQGNVTSGIGPFIDTGLNFNNKTDPDFTIHDWRDLKIEADAKVFNRSLVGPIYSQRYCTGTNPITIDGVVYNVEQWSDRFGHSMGLSNTDYLSSSTYSNHNYTSTNINPEHRCIFINDIKNQHTSIYDTEDEDYLLYTSTTVTQISVSESETGRIALFVGGIPDDGNYFTGGRLEMNLYSFKVTKISDTDGESILFDGIPVMEYNTGKCGLFDRISGNFFPKTVSIYPSYTTPTAEDISLPITKGNIINPIYNVVGTQEVIEDMNNNTSSVLNLLALDSTVIDTQKLKEGIINRQVGIKVLDGTETWGYTNQGTYGNSTFASTDAITDRDYTKRFAYCTHFQNTESTSDLATNGKMFLGVSSQKINFCNTGFTTPADFADWLKAQYNAGTPVIILYPLTNDFDFSTTPQNSLQITPLTQIYGSVSNLPIDTYKKIINNTIDVTNKFTGIERINSNAFWYLLNNNPNVTGDLSFTSLRTVENMHYSFKSTNITSASFPALVDILQTQAFMSCFEDCNYLQTLSFGALQSIYAPSGSNRSDIFFKICYTTNPNPSLTAVYFPFLTTIGVNVSSAFQSAFGNQINLTTVNMPLLTGIYSDYVFQNAFSGCTGLQSISFPSLTTITKSNVFTDAFNGCTGLTEIHFKASIQSTIEAQTGYSSRWGASNATIYFDL